MAHPDDVINSAVCIYKELSKVPALDSVFVSKNSSDDILHWQAKWSHRDVTRQSKVSFISSGSLVFEGQDLAPVKNPFANEITTEKLMSVSSSNLKACLHEIDVKSEVHCFLDIWKGSKKISSIDQKTSMEKYILILYLDV